MKYTGLFSAAVAAFASTAAAISVSGAAEGFAKGVTGGGNAAPVYPNSIDELVSYLGDSSPRVVVLSKTYGFPLYVALRYCFNSNRIVSDCSIASTSVAPREPSPRVDVLLGVLAPAASWPLTRTTGATTTSPAPLRSPSSSKSQLELLSQTFLTFFSAMRPVCLASLSLATRPSLVRVTRVLSWARVCAWSAAPPTSSSSEYMIGLLLGMCLMKLLQEHCRHRPQPSVRLGW